MAVGKNKKVGKKEKPVVVKSLILSLKKNGMILKHHPHFQFVKLEKPWSQKHKEQKLPVKVY